MSLGLGLPFGSFVFLIDVIGLLLIFLVYLSNPRAKTNKFFAIMVFLMFIWVNLAFLSRLEGQGTFSLLWLRIAWSITPLFFAMIFLFSTSISSVQKQYRGLNIINLLLGTVLFFITLFTGLIIKNIVFINGILNIIYGELIYLFFGVIFFLTILSFIVLFKKYLKADTKEERSRIGYLMFGFLFFFIMNSIFNIAYPFFLRVFHLYEFGDYSTIFFLGTVAYAVVEKQLFGIKVISTVALVALINILFGLDIFIFTQDLLVRLYKGLALIILFYFGYLLIRSVLKEIEQRERIERIEKDLERAYAVEKRANEELKKIDKQKNDFLMQTQHDMRSPLGVLMGYVELLLDGTYGKMTKKSAEVLSKIQIVLQNKINDVNNFLDIEQFKMGKGVVNLRPGVELSGLMEEINASLLPKAENKGIYLKFTGFKEVPAISADKIKLKAAIFNIIDNAIKYTLAGGVNVVCSQTNPKVLIKIKDTGIGIPQDKIEKIFKGQFERTEGAKKTAGGAGVGLYLSAQIIEMHKGKVWAESLGEGKGSVFYVEIPVV